MPASSYLPASCCSPPCGCSSCVTYPTVSSSPPALLQRPQPLHLPHSPCPLSHNGRGGEAHWDAVRLPSPPAREGLGVMGKGDLAATLSSPPGLFPTGPTSSALSL